MPLATPTTPSLEATLPPELRLNVGGGVRRSRGRRVLLTFRTVKGA